MERSRRRSGVPSLEREAEEAVIMHKSDRRLKPKDLINIGIFTAIYFVIMFAVACLGYIPIFIPLLAALCPLAGGIPFMLL
jgi:hypothetical protein